MWLGPYPRVHIMDPTHLKATFTQIDEIQKPNFNPIVKLLLDGVLTYEGQKWAKHKKIISPAFYLLKLKVSFSSNSKKKKKKKFNNYLKGTIIPNLYVITGLKTKNRLNLSLN